MTIAPTANPGVKVTLAQIAQRAGPGTIDFIEDLGGRTAIDEQVM